MKKSISFLLICGLLLSSVSCKSLQNANNTQKGAGLGVVGGALAGYLIGKDLKGALIGAAIGGVAGGVIGNVMDKEAKRIKEVLPGAEVERVGEGIHLILDDNSGVHFEFNSADLTSDTKENLDKLAEVFIEFPDTDVVLQGHTDSTGDEAYNQGLSERRARSVANYLSQKGVASTRMAAEGFGEASPRFTNATAEGRAKNRRVEFGIVAGEQMIKDARAQEN